MFKFIIRLTKPYLKLILVVILFQIGQTLLSLYLPTINAGIIDYGVANTDTQYIIQRGVLMVALSGGTVCLRRRREHPRRKGSLVHRPRSSRGRLPYHFVVFSKGNRLLRSAHFDYPRDKRR